MFSCTQLLQTDNNTDLGASRLDKRHLNNKVVAMLCNTGRPNISLRPPGSTGLLILPIRNAFLIKQTTDTEWEGV